MIGKDTIRCIESIVHEIVDPLGFDLVEAKYFRTNSDIVVRLLIDRIEGGITLHECSELNNRIGKEIEDKNIINQKYLLEVSSPGLDRDLIEPKDFKRTINREIRIFLNEQHNEKTEFKGKLMKIDEQGINIIDQENKELKIPFTKITKAKQVIL